MNPIGDTWNVVGNLFLFTDHAQARTTGAMVSSQIASAATMSTTVNPPENGAVKYTQKASRNDVTTGYVNTSDGRVYTTVKTGREWRNAGTASDKGLVQSITQSDRITQNSTSRIGARTVHSSALTESYPIRVDASSADYTNDQNFSLTATVRMGQQVSSVVRDSRVPTVRGWNWTVDSYGILGRTDGVTSESDGNSTSSYIGTDDRARPYIHYIKTDHGKVLVDRHLP